MTFIEKAVVIRWRYGWIQWYDSYLCSYGYPHDLWNPGPPSLGNFSCSMRRENDEEIKFRHQGTHSCLSFDRPFPIGHGSNLFTCFLIAYAGVRASGHRPVRPLALSLRQVGNLHLAFGLQGRQRLPIHARDMSLVLMSGLI